ncbi:MAG: transporter substrate-binding domain-containing protein [Thiotrichales bacterium]|nr:MAG: transporter substrate-binding domain-containing protein [Thiotrichales bacterium]
MKFFSRLFASLLFLLAVTNHSHAASQDVFDQIIKKGEIRVGISVMAPWVMKDKDGKYIGFEIDIAKQLASDMGVKPVFKHYDWNKLIPALVNREIDIIASGISITPKRGLKIRFSNPYSSSGYNLVSNLKLTKDFTSIKDLNDSKVFIGVVKGTVSESLVPKVFPRAKLDSFKDNKEATEAVVNGTVHAFVASAPIPRFVALKYPDDVDLPLEKPLLVTKEAFAINKHNPEMLAYLNSWITAHQADAWIKSTHAYWFKSLKWRRKVSE